MAYDLEKIKAKIERFNGGGRDKKKSGPKLPWWSPPLGVSTFRFLPFNDGNDQPFYEALHYKSKLLVGEGWPVPSPCQFDMDDPIADHLKMLSAEMQPREVWKVMQQLRPKESYYAPIIVRGAESEGVKVWNMSPTRVKEVYEILADEDNMEFDLFDPQKGCDFRLTVSETDKEWNGRRVKEYKLKERPKGTKLLGSAKEIKALLETIPDFEGYFRGRLRDPEQYEKMLQNALHGGLDGNSSEETGTSRNEDTSTKTEVETKAAADVEDAFADI